MNGIHTTLQVVPATNEACHSWLLVCMADAHEGAGVWLSAAATFAAVLVALLIPVAQGIAERSQVKQAFYAYIGHAHTLMRIAFNDYGGHPQGQFLISPALALLDNARAAAENAMALPYLRSADLIDAANLRSAANQMRADLMRFSEYTDGVRFDEISSNWITDFKPMIDVSRQRLRQAGADVGDDNATMSVPGALKA